jgi:hypothetical protein
LVATIAAAVESEAVFTLEDFRVPFKASRVQRVCEKAEGFLNLLGEGDDPDGLDISILRKFQYLASYWTHSRWYSASWATAVSVIDRASPSPLKTVLGQPSSMYLCQVTEVSISGAFRIP